MNRVLAEQIMEMAEADQVARHQLLKLENDPHSTAEDREKAVAQINTVDTSNLKKAKQLFQEYGYPGKSLVGATASHRFWIIVQHCDEEVSFQQQVVKELKKTVAQGNADAKDYAYLLDQVKVNQGEPQVFGTQIELNAKGTSFQAQEMIAPTKVNQRRKEVGLEPLEAYLDTCNQLYYSSLNSDD